MYLNSKKYEKKYKKYKNKYQILKSNISGVLLPKVPSVNGGACDPLPNPDEEDLFTTQNLLDLCPDGKGTFWRKNYNTK